MTRISATADVVLAGLTSGAWERCALVRWLRDL
jgi:hypothetical protein